MASGATFQTGEQKIRPGVFVQVQNIGSLQPTGNRTGSVAVIFRSNWGPLNTATYMYGLDSLYPMWGPGGAPGNNSIDAVSEAFLAGVQQVVGVRLGGGTGGTVGTAATAVLADTGSASVVTLTGAQPGTRPNIGAYSGGWAFTVRDSPTLTSPQMRDFLLYEGTNLLGTFNFPKGLATGGVITAAALVGTTTQITTTTAHGLSSGQYVTLAGITPVTSNLIGTWQVLTVPSSTTFTIGQTLTPGWVSGGTVTVNEIPALVSGINQISSSYITAAQQTTTTGTGGAITAVTNTSNAVLTMTTTPGTVVQPGMQITLAALTSSNGPGLSGAYTVLATTTSSPFTITINNSVPPGTITGFGGATPVTAPVFGTGLLNAVTNVGFGNASATPAGVAGTDPVPNSTDLLNALSVLEAEDWNVLAVDAEDMTSFNTIQAYIDRVRYQGKRCIAVLGQPAVASGQPLVTTTVPSLGTRFSNASQFNDFAIVYVANGFQSPSGNREGYRAAARVAGMIASTRVASSLTHMPVLQGTGLVGSLSNADLDRAINAGCVVFSRSQGKQIQIEYGINTYITPDTNHDAGWHKIRRVRTRDQLIDRIAQALDPVVGNVTNSADGRATLTMLGQQVVNAMIREGSLLAGTVVVDPGMPPAGDSVWFRADVDDLDSAEHIYFQFGFRFTAPAVTAGVAGR